MKAQSKTTGILVALALLCGVACRRDVCAQTQPHPGEKQKVIFDTDIGDDIDDAFALALAMSSPRIEVIGVTAAWGDTDLRARLAERLLRTTGHGDIPVTAGPKTHASSNFTQARWAQLEPEPAQPVSDVDEVAERGRLSGQPALLPPVPAALAAAPDVRDRVDHASVQ